MSNVAPRVWARHYQDDWQARAGDPRLPYWLRVTALAYGCHADNGHARFKRGEVALILGSVDKETGEVRPFANVRREIARAVEYGWLEEGSYWACLIVPAHSIRRGDLGRKPKPCPLGAKHSSRCRSASSAGLASAESGAGEEISSPARRSLLTNRSLSERNGDLKPTPSERFEARTAHSVSDHPPFPLSDLSPVRQDRNPTANRRTA